MGQESELSMLQKHAEELSEFFDTVQIFATRHESGELNGTVNVQYGCGNWFARYGQIRNWINKEEQASRLEVKPQDDL